MKKDSQLLKKRNEKINQEYKEFDQQGNGHDEIVSKLSERYFLMPRTIYAILCGESDRRLIAK